ncbi:hypothetical protein A2W54_00440 [Candidatus Giovannonibacteria bacterium RIFCSPHIGHO2_02_43_13]|uniref:Response regulatory domain-containing protein n=1 Tax=Candidatus Giovannonibacteria bacterium RIFCSPHIGHO2_02_43_13 TaxID=1798330 RepID=A0A1F5WRI5_9BACT|nr:MAG: hypothetical protein A3E06_01945 [Candidatus Giovannonibacteria bacterium RIFCSPHIGHO2_12_FULL_44_42]OGF78282.1 MAG: hypothetical protein A2W54_00440 [Candidatus Giovannonibacteria bacterium RIFCSPHIGHO2_02_43_13]OGF96699.1 MAG: hypothetical protein A3H08_03025 [Candidatus Giovannonibacteria bacterium RIFCSPLOWO2_12_FULL_44_32]
MIFDTIEKEVIRRKSMYILIVDDDVQVLSALKRKLEDMGHVVVEAIGPSHSLYILSVSVVFGPDLIITDYNMPGAMNGVELAKEIRASGHRMPIWLLSASNINEEMAKDAGIEKVFLKYRPDKFWSAIKNFGKEG